MMRVTAHCSPRPAKGELKGLLLAKNLEKGRIPSRPSSWLTRPWEKRTERTFPIAERAMMTEMAVPPAVDPNIRVMNSAARSRLEERMTALGTAAKKAMLTSMSAERERKREREWERERERVRTRLQIENTESGSMEKRLTDHRDEKHSDGSGSLNGLDGRLDLRHGVELERKKR